MTTVIQYSGGKDSLVCLHLYKNEPNTVVVFVDTGSTLPHVVPYIKKTVKDLNMNLYIASPASSCHVWQEDNGYPSDIVPVNASPSMKVTTKDKYKTSIIPYIACCNRNIWQPMMKALDVLKATTVIRGSKLADHLIGVPDGHIENGRTFLSPLWNWTDEDVFSYLKDNNIATPPQYTLKGADSLDCWSCTAYMDEAGVARYKFMKEQYPEIYDKAKKRFDAVSSTLRKAFDETTLNV